MFRWDLVWHFLFEDPNLLFLEAAWLTLWISVVAQAAGVFLGLFLALMRMSRFPLLAFPARAYIWFFRGSPLLVQVLLLWDGLPRVINDPRFLLPNYACVLVAFSRNEGAYMAEIVRAGITSVDPGQMEAGKSLGMRYALAMRRIVLPQAARVIVPPLGNEFNNMLKTTSLLVVIAVPELYVTFEQLNGSGSSQFHPFELFLACACWFLLLTTIWSIIQAFIERRVGRGYGGERPPGIFDRLFGARLRRAFDPSQVSGGR